MVQTREERESNGQRGELAYGASRAESVALKFGFPFRGHPAWQGCDGYSSGTDVREGGMLGARVTQMGQETSRVRRFDLSTQRNHFAPNFEAYVPPEVLYEAECVDTLQAVDPIRRALHVRARIEP